MFYNTILHVILKKSKIINFKQPLSIAGQSSPAILDFKQKNLYLCLLNSGFDQVV